ncbi:hypothetical protein D3C72_1186450 [compost metagenome]
MEKELYIEKFARDYDISKEAIYAEVNKIIYANTSAVAVLEKSKPTFKIKAKESENTIDNNTIKRENTIISLLIDSKYAENIYKKIKHIITPEEFKFILNKSIIIKLYEEYEKGNININSIIDSFDEDIQNHITMIMAYDFEISNPDKAIEDLLVVYEKERLNNKKNEIMLKLEEVIDNEHKRELEKELNDTIMALVKIK